MIVHVFKQNENIRANFFMSVSGDSVALSPIQISDIHESLNTIHSDIGRVIKLASRIGSVCIGYEMFFKLHRCSRTIRISFMK